MGPRGGPQLKLPLRKCKNFVDNLKQIFYSINAIIPDFQSWMVKNGVKPQIKTCDLTSFLFVIP